MILFGFWMTEEVGNRGNGVEGCKWFDKGYAKWDSLLSGGDINREKGDIGKIIWITEKATSNHIINHLPK